MVMAVPLKITSRVPCGENVESSSGTSSAAGSDQHEVRERAASKGMSMTTAVRVSPLKFASTYSTSVVEALPLD